MYTYIYVKNTQCLLINNIQFQYFCFQDLPVNQQIIVNSVWNSRPLKISWRFCSIFGCKRRTCILIYLVHSCNTSPFCNNNTNYYLEQSKMKRKKNPASVDLFSHSIQDRCRKIPMSLNVLTCYQLTSVLLYSPFFLLVTEIY